MNTLKKVVASVMALATVSAMGATAFADDGYKNNYFTFKLSSNGEKWSSGEKEDDLDFASIYTTGGYVSSSKPIYGTVYKTMNNSNAYRISTTATITSPSARYTVNYTTHRGTGSWNYLCGETGAYSAEITGYWRA